MKDGMIFEQRDIVLIPFPYSNLFTLKKRPVLIVSNFRNNLNSEDIICCALTSNKKFFHNGILINNKDLEFGNLNYESVIKPSKIFTILKSKIIKKLGKLNIEKTKEVIRSLNYFIEVE